MPTFHFVSPNPVTLSRRLDVKAYMNEALGIETFPALPENYTLGLYTSFNEAYEDWALQGKTDTSHKNCLIVEVRGPALSLTPEQEEAIAAKKPDETWGFVVDAKNYTIVRAYHGKNRLFDIESAYTLANIKDKTQTSFSNLSQFIKKRAFPLSMAASLFSVMMAFNGNSVYVAALKWGLNATLAFGVTLLLAFCFAAIGYKAGKMVWEGLQNRSLKQKSAKKSKHEVGLSHEAGFSVDLEAQSELLGPVVANPTPDNPLYELPAVTPGGPTSADIDWGAPNRSVTAQPVPTPPTGTPTAPRYVDVVVTSQPSEEPASANPRLSQLLKEIAALEAAVNFGDKHKVSQAFSRALREEPEEELQIAIAEKEVSLLKGFRSAYDRDVRDTPGRRDTPRTAPSFNRAREEKKLIKDLENEVTNLNQRQSTSIYNPH